MIDYCIVSKKADREVNEDSVECKILGDKMCFVVCDGLGGHGRGEEASALVTKIITDMFVDESNIDVFLEDSVCNAQEKLMESQREKHARNEMKTTLVALMIDELNVKWIHVGDSRLYTFNKNKVKERTIDHSVPQMLVLAKELKEKNIRNHPDRNRLLRVMGIEWDTPKYEVSKITNIKETQAFLLCTDGFWELIEEKEMCKLLKKSSSANEWVELMEQVVLKNGKDKNMDNYTAIAIIVG